MRKILALFVSLLLVAQCTDPFDKDSIDVFPSRVIYYTSSDGDRLFPESTELSTFGAVLLSNTYENGVGTLVFDGDVKNIGENAFKDCSALTSITIPNSVTSIDRYAFYGCSGLEEVHITDLNAWKNISFGDYDANPLGNSKAKLYLNGVEVTYY